MIAVLAGNPAAAQVALDRADPTAASKERTIEQPAVAPQRAPIPVEVEARPAEAAAGASVLLGAVRFAGLSALAPGDFADVIEPYLGKFATHEDLADLAGRISDRLHKRGLIFATASIEPQRLSSGVLVVTVDEGRIDEIRLDGPENAAVRAALAPLTQGEPVTLARVERRLLIAGDIDGIRIVSSRYVRERGRGVLVVRLTADHLAAHAAFDNRGSRPLGPEEVTLQVDVNALFAADDAVTFLYEGTLAQPRELQYGRVRYAKRVSSAGTEVAVSASYSASHPGAYLAPYDINSRSWLFGLSAVQPLQRRRSASLWLSGEFDVRDLAQDRYGALARHDRLAVLRLGLYGAGTAAGGRLRVNATVSRGLGILGATGAADPLASRTDASGVFTSFEAWADWTRSFGPFSLRMAVEAQLAAEPLLVSEEIGLGGTSFLRGYDWSERLGDQGAAGSLELRYDLDQPLGLIRHVQLYNFVDGGEVANLHQGGPGGTGSLASAGAGIRADVTRSLGATAEIAIPLSGPRYDTGNADPRLNLSVSKSF